MIDHIALALGHGLLAVALLRLVLRAGLDDDPLIGSIEAEADDQRKRTSTAGRNAARRAQDPGEDDPALKQQSGSADNIALKQRSGSANQNA
jgi:hypothetical protein